MSTPYPIIPGRVPIATFGYNFPSWPNVAPFTYQDGVTNAKLVESLIAYVDRTLVPHVDDETAKIIEAWKETVTQIVDDVVDNSVELQDPVLAGIIANEGTQARAILDLLLSGLISEDANDPGTFVVTPPVANEGEIQPDPNDPGFFQ